MPSLSDKVESGDMLLRMMFYGAPKTKKTWTAATAALANYNVIILDGDHGYHILTQVIPEEFRKRITIMEVYDKRDESTFALFMAELFNKGRVYWDEATRSVVKRPMDATPSTVYLDLARLDKNCVLVCDSWTALTWSISMRYAREHMIDMTDPQKTDQEAYAWTGTLATWMLTKLATVQSHLVVIGHSTMYSKWTNNKSTGRRELDWERMVMKSTSGPHAMTISDKVSDILYFYNLSDTVTKIDTAPAKDREGGSRILKPGSYDQKNLHMPEIFRLAGISTPDASNPLFDLSLPDQSVRQEAQPTNTPIEPVQSSGVKLAGLSKLMKK